MKTLIIGFILLVMVLFFVAQISISFSPFQVKFGRPLFAIGLILIVIGVALIQVDSKREGIREGVDLLFETTKKQLLNKDSE